MRKRAKKNPVCSINPMLNEDLLTQILTKVTEKDDRKAFSEVCKQWLSVERLSRTTLRLHRPMFPLVLLTRFPNVVDFRTTLELTKLRKRRNKRGRFHPKSDNRLRHVAKAFPRLGTFVVISDNSSHVQSLLGPEGLVALGKGCPELATFVFEGSNVVGNAGLDAFFQSPRNLRFLRLCDNHIISDVAFRAIGSSNISCLELIFCSQVTDVGLGFLADGSVSRTLKKLVIEYCRRITDDGIQLLVKMNCLEHLDLSHQRVTDVGGVAISRIQTLKELKLSDVKGLADPTVVALANNCRNLEVLALCCDGVVTADGIGALSSHQCLKHFAFFGVENIGGSDVRRFVFGCPSLESLVVNGALARSFGWMNKNNDRRKTARRVVKPGSSGCPLPHFMTTAWD